MPSAPLVIVVIFRARPRQEEALGAELRALVEPTVREPGCLNYDLHISNEQSDLFFFHETWQSVEHHQAHRDTAHVQRFLAISPDLVVEPIREIKGRRLDA
ncbi:MAG: putative quinol monooxygenase [Chloroflexota bacterium]